MTDRMDDHATDLWRRVTDYITTMGNLAGYVHVDLCRIGSLWPHPTFPEQHAEELADRLDKLAASLRDSAKNAAERRKEAA